MAQDLPKLSETELALLKHLWAAGAVTVRDLHDVVVSAGHEWAYTTVQTMLSRMEDKGYVRVDRDGFAHVFSASVSQESLVGRRLDELVDGLCGGAAAPLLLHLAQGRRFTADEIADFRRLLDAAEVKPSRRVPTQSRRRRKSS